MCYVTWRQAQGSSNAKLLRLNLFIQPHLTQYLSLLLSLILSHFLKFPIKILPKSRLRESARSRRPRRKSPRLPGRRVQRPSPFQSSGCA